MLEEILKHATKHPKTVILGLLIVIAAGTIAGGLWIRNLQSALDQRDKIISERLALVEERHRSDLRTLKQANAVLSAESKIIQKSAGDVSVQLREVAKLTNEIRSKGVVTEEVASSLERASQQVTKDVEALARAVERTQDMEQWMGAVDVPEAAAEETLELSPIYFILIATGIAFFLVMVLFRRRKGAQKPKDS